MSELFPPRIEEVIEELEREKLLRKRVYPNRIHTGRMTQKRADRQMYLLDEAIKLLKGLQCSTSPGSSSGTSLPSSASLQRPAA